MEGDRGGREGKRTIWCQGREGKNWGKKRRGGKRGRVPEAKRNGGLREGGELIGTMEERRAKVPGGGKLRQGASV